MVKRGKKLEELKKKLRQEAVRRYGENITPCSHKTFDKCFTLHKDKLLFWFNIGEDTKVITHKIEQEA
jgi:hypothetical protein